MNKIINKNLEYFKESVINCLNVGIDKAVKQDYIKQRTGLSKREIRRIIQELRREGYPICSSTYDGYWLAKTKQDLNICIDQILAQARTLNETAASLLEIKSKLPEE